MSETTETVARIEGYRRQYGAYSTLWYFVLEEDEESAYTVGGIPAPNEETALKWAIEDQWEMVNFENIRKLQNREWLKVETISLDYDAVRIPFHREAQAG